MEVQVIDPPSRIMFVRVFVVIIVMSQEEGVLNTCAEEDIDKTGNVILASMTCLSGKYVQ